jgi:hypothetical protein
MFFLRFTRHGIAEKHTTIFGKQNIGEIAQIQLRSLD